MKLLKKLATISLIAVFVMPNSAMAAVTVGTPTTSTSTTISYTVNASTNVLAVSIAGRSGSVSGVTYNGVALTQAIAKAQGISNAEVWYLLTPATGTHNVVITTSSIENNFAVVEILGASQTAIGGTGTAGASSNANHSVTVTVQGTSGAVIDADRMDGVGCTISVDAGQTEMFNGSNGNGNNASSYETHSGSNVTMSWTRGGSCGTPSWALAAVEFKEASAAASSSIESDLILFGEW